MEHSEYTEDMLHSVVSELRTVLNSKPPHELLVSLSFLFDLPFRPCIINTPKKYITMCPLVSLRLTPPNNNVLFVRLLLVNIVVAVYILCFVQQNKQT